MQFYVIYFSDFMFNEIDIIKLDDKANLLFIQAKRMMMRRTF